MGRDGKDGRAAGWVSEAPALETAIVFAAPADEEELRGMLTGTGMDLAGDIEEHVVLRRGREILAVARLYQADEEVFHLLVLAVAAPERGRGTGSRFLRALTDRPWDYCRDAEEPAGGSYLITTVARGPAAGFYGRVGFRACEFAELPPPFDGQCDACPDRKRCRPAPLAFSGPPPGAAVW